MSPLSDTLVDVFGRRQRESTAEAASGGDGDPFARYEPQFKAYLEQARWHLEQQQRRASSFQQTAIAVIGFDGVLLAVLVSGNALGGTTRYEPRWWLVVTSAALLVMSSLAGVAAVRPRATSVPGARQTVQAWANFTAHGGWNQTTQHFAEMLLAVDPPSEAARSRLGQFLRWARSAVRLREPSRQPLLAATHLATVRGRWATCSGVLLALGIGCLAVALIVTPADASSGRQPVVGTQTDGGTHG